MSVADLGDTETLGEMAQLSAPKWDGTGAGIRAVFVCSPAHVASARQRLPKVPIVLVAHQGYSHKLPECPEASTVVSFSIDVDRLIQQDVQIRPSLRHLHRFAVIRPWFEAGPQWKWEARKVWTMLSRPSTRKPLAFAMLDSVRAFTKTQVFVFGQDQPNGLLDALAKLRWIQSSSCYLSTLHPRAGFGLAEHEAMASGCPVVGTLWGELEALDRLGGAVPSIGFRSYGDIYNLADLVDRVATDEKLARLVSEEQNQFIAQRYTRLQMDESISKLIECIH